MGFSHVAIVAHDSDIAVLEFKPLEYARAVFNGLTDKIIEHYEFLCRAGYLNVGLSRDDGKVRNIPF